MTFEELQKANETLSTMKIERKDKRTGQVTSKDYAEVNQRIKVFRMLYPEGAIITDMLTDDGERCVFRAIVHDSDGKTLGTGTAFELKSSSFINATSYIENCETSAVGRALAMCGIGIDTSIASYEEVANAQATQDKKAVDTQPDTVKEASAKAKVMAYVVRHNMSPENIEKICKCYKVERLAQMSLQQCEHYIKALEKNGGNIDE
ncbi:MAG: hypothetical protein MJ007_02025 [Paludibacteraceae bacterium]|nr:hypothetical protein [Paludibacteraceae bacterium]